MKTLSVSLVTYKSDKKELEILLKSFEKTSVDHDLFVIDQSPDDSLRSFFADKSVIYDYTGNNLGYGGGHNCGIRKGIEQGHKYHLVTNPDVYFNSDTLSNMVKHLDSDSSIGLTCPKIFWPDGRLQPTCRRDPKPFDLFARRFLPSSWFQSRLDRYSMQDKNYDEKIDVEFSPGSFMLFRIDALKKVEGFDETFFMYLEDADITRRIRSKGYAVKLTPDASVFHERRSGHRMNISLMLTFFRSIVIYFNKFGWRPFY